MPNQIQENNMSTAATPQTNPETQSLFDLFIINGMELIYNDKQIKTIFPRISSNKDPVKTIAELLVDIIVRVVSSAKANKQTIPPEVILHGGNVLFAELLKVLEAAGMESLNEEQKTAIWQMATGIYLDQAVKSGQITKQELIAYGKQSEQTEVGKRIMQQTQTSGAAPTPASTPTQTQPVPSNGLAAPQGGI